MKGWRPSPPRYGIGGRSSDYCQAFSASEMAVPHRRRCTRHPKHRGPHSWEMDGKPYDRMQARSR